MTCRILVVDDSTPIQKVIKIAFSKYPVEIFSAGSLNEALRECDKAKPDLIIADGSLPGVTSASDFSKLMAKSHGAAMIMLMGSYDSVRESDLRAAGFETIVKKPFDAIELLEASEKLLAGKLKLNQGSGSNASPSINQTQNQGQSVFIPTPPISQNPASIGQQNIGADSGSSDTASRLQFSTPTRTNTSGRVPPPIPPPIAIPQFDLDMTSSQISESRASQMNQGQRPQQPRMNQSPDQQAPSAIPSFLLELDQQQVPSAPSIPGIKLDADQKGRPAYDPGNVVAPIAQNQVPPFTENQSRKERYPTDRNQHELPLTAQIARHQHQTAAGSGDSFIAVAEESVRQQLPHLVNSAVEKYCRDHFKAIAREVLTQELRRLADEKAKYLVDQ
ncbi:MAG: response regulator [Proteobacteria bacterium]|nr:response regulator [Pseudomonadota bacterium]